MFSKTLIRLIDEAIIPAVVIISAKVGGVFLLSNVFNINWDLKTLSIVSGSSQDFVALNSYSNLIMFISISVGLVWVIIKSHIFHDTHITPTLSAKLVSLNLTRLIGTTVEIYHQAVIWWLYAVLIALLISLQFYFGLVYVWVAFISVVVVVSSTWFLVLDIEREVTLAKRDDAFQGASLDFE